MKWIVALGNPGPKYAATRHNIGFMAADQWAAERSLIFKPMPKFKAQLAEGQIDGHSIYLIKPQTYMNLSGETARAFMNYYKASLDDLIVIYDDMDTELGKVRLRYQGSAGGHNGIRSLIQHLGTEKFNRVRMGISRPAAGAPVVDYVLSTFPKSEHELAKQTVDRTVKALEFALNYPFEKAMAEFNSTL